MCFPTDDNPKVPSGIVFGRDPSAAQYFGSGLEIDGDALVNGAGEWDIPMGDEFSIQEGNNAWDFQNMQSNNNSFLQQQLSQQQQQQFESQGFQNGSFVNPLSKLGRRASNVNGTFQNPAHLWKQAQQPFENRGASQNMSWNGNSIPVAPPRPPFSSSVSNSQIASMMAGPSLGAPEFQVAQGVPPMWNKNEAGSEPLEQWMKGAIHGSKPAFPARQTAPPKPATLPQELMSQLKPWAATETPEQAAAAAAAQAELADDICSDDDEGTKDKKMRRMLSNRASAKRSRQRRQERLGELEIQTAKLRVENASLSRKYTEAVDQAKHFQKENESLKAELDAVRAELNEVKLQKSSSDNKQESGKASAHSAANHVKSEAESFQEAHSEKKDCENQSAEKKDASGLAKEEKCSPRSVITGEEKGYACRDMELPCLEDDGCLLSKDMDIATDEWLESLVQCLDD